jgi:hypothetical protein
MHLDRVMHDTRKRVYDMFCVFGNLTKFNFGMYVAPAVNFLNPKFLIRCKQHSAIAFHLELLKKYRQMLLITRFERQLNFLHLIF